MSVQSLLNQSITIYNKSSFDAYGRVTVGAGTTTTARFSPKTKKVLLPNGTVETIDALAYVNPDVTVSVDDRIDYGSDRYKVVSKYPTPDGDGNTHFIRLDLVKWRQ